METFLTITLTSEVTLFSRISLELFAILLCYMTKQCFLSASFISYLLVFAVKTSFIFSLPLQLLY